jgi:hypothetical protein
VRLHRNVDGTAELQVLQAVPPANLSKAYLVDANLTGANLEGVMAKDAHFYGGKTKLQGALMSRIRLINANLGTADLQGAQLRGATLANANLVGAKLMGADLSPYGDQAADLSGAYLSGADFTDAKLNGTELTDAAVSTTSGVHLFTLGPEARAELAAGRSFLLGARFDKYVKALNDKDVEDLQELLENEAEDKRVELSADARISVLGEAAMAWSIMTSGPEPKKLAVSLEKVAQEGAPDGVMAIRVLPDGAKEEDKKALENEYFVPRNQTP